LLRQIVREKSINASNGITYIEPFAGGAGVAINLLLEGAVSRIVINDYDKAIYSFWRALIHETGNLIELINRTPVTVGEWHKQKNIYLTLNSRYSLELGFAAFFLNRTNRSGILNAGPIGGYEQNSTYLINARYNKDMLIKRIQNIAARKKDIFVYNKEIRSFITQIIPQYALDAIVYFDPPYYANGKRLYKNFLVYNDHVEIAELISKRVTCDWILTYDDAPEIHAIYSHYNYVMRKYVLNYSVANKGKGTELIIFKNSALVPVNQGHNSGLGQLSITAF
jgi:DNA adenine methylase